MQCYMERARDFLFFVSFYPVFLFCSGVKCNNANVELFVAVPVELHVPLIFWVHRELAVSFSYG